MAKTNLKQKLLLIVFGCLLALLLLEIGMSLAGAVLLYVQDKRNKISDSADNYRILCLGESTTALGGNDSYPSKLEELLNQYRKNKKFSVINKGLISTTSDQILANADENLNIYKPHMVIVMMGINDRFHLKPHTGSVWLRTIMLRIQDLKVSKLAFFLYQHVTHRIQELKTPLNLDEAYKKSDNYAPKEDFLKNFIVMQYQNLNIHLTAALNYEKNQQQAQAQAEYLQVKRAMQVISASYIDLAERYLQQNRLKEAQTFLEQASTFNENNTDLYLLWGNFYLAQGKQEEALFAFNKAMTYDPQDNQMLLGVARALYLDKKPEALVVYLSYLKKNPKDYWGHIELARWFKEQKSYDQAMQLLNEAVRLSPSLERAYLDMGEIYREQGLVKQEEEYYLSLIKQNPKQGILFQLLGQYYKKHGPQDLADQYLKKASDLGSKEYTWQTWSNYRMLVDKILKRGIKVVVMQYPLRSIDSLKNYLGEKNGVYFIENRTNFRSALESGRYNEYFWDNFAQDFGHCTAKGNELIAKNLIPYILKIFE